MIRDNFAYFSIKTCGYSLELPHRGDSIKTCCGCSLESPHQGDSNEYPQHVFMEN